MFFYLTYTQLAIIGPQDVWRTSPPTSRRRSLKILFDRLGDVLIWGPGDVLIWRPWDVLKWRPGDVLIWCSRDVPGRSIQDVPRTFLGRSIEDSNLEYSNFDVPAFFLFNFSSRTFSINQIYLKSFQHSRCIENPVNLLRWRSFCKIN